MSSHTQNPLNPKEEQPDATNNNANSINKNAAKKEVAKQQKLHSKATAFSLSSATSHDAPYPLAAHYGDVPLEEVQSKAITVREWTEVEIQVRKVYCVSKAVLTLPINNEDAACSDVEID
ncbi:hypothetical protein RHMOL_Rhmol03G0125700 [Rhododendron molle]|uniref:Uncharacterized protein n=3 Tax=Rhododendron molle TaxID=49168 RepID=A0ACC0PG08_RHOML|nr:hypothetical protein RHMOL_Rhmol03G0125700 [Rhododendron molle]KAI8563651.1 hypothetical protein RHMOL_Rhmol03G0125700 [Rhododendron molle]KAI8563652.1 hypothetical protein RHMOL_Rhmol03G0125700 [Rhododendron molle]